jgi:hypothetical protein
MMLKERDNRGGRRGLSAGKGCAGEGLYASSVRKERHCVGTHRYSTERHRPSIGTVQNDTDALVSYCTVLMCTDIGLLV